MQATSDKTASANFTQTGKEFVDEKDVTVSFEPGKTGYCPYYQWGRKDAFRSVEYTAAPADGTSLVFKKEDVTVGATIQNPTTYYSDISHCYKPYILSLYYNAWNATYPENPGTSKDKIDGLEKVVKTVYDPCPVGYTVSPGNTFTAFDISNFTVEDNGSKYTIKGKKLFLPYSGHRIYNSGAFSVTSGGEYWMAVGGNGADQGRSFTFSSTGVNPVSAGPARTWGKAIRPVSENVRQH